MKIKDRLRGCFYRTMFSFTIFALTFLFMRFVTQKDGVFGSVSTVVLGLIFWVSLIFGIVNAIQTRKYEKAFAYMHGEEYSITGRPGALRFFSNVYAVVADVVLILSILAAIALAIFTPDEQRLYFAVLFSSSLSLSMHCLLNSDTLRVLKSTFDGRMEK